MKIRLLLASLAAATAMTVAMPAFATDTAQEFVDKAAAGGIFEVNSSKIAVEKAHDQGVKDFARKMIDDHGAANAKLETIAGEQKLTVPTELDAKHKADLDALQKAADPVDAAYVDMQRDAHADAVKLFEAYAKDGDNAELKTFAKQTVPTLKKHQEMVDKIAAAMGEQPAATSSTAPSPVSGADANAAAPVPGANSFTEDQARSRIEAAGFAEVSALTKDDQGIWRGEASKAGKKTTVALDYQGNVVAGSN